MIETGIKIYGIWAGDGEPVAFPDLHISIEDWNGVDTAVMTLKESDGLFGEDYDGSSTEAVDMRVYPRDLSGSGGTIKLIDNGWYTQFQNEGFSFRGSRVDRFYTDESGVVALNTFYVSSARDLVGLIQLQLSPITKQLEKDLTGSVNGYRQPFVVGEWKGVSIDAEGSGESPLFGGTVFRHPYDSVNPFPVSKTLDIAGAPVAWNIYAVPSSAGFDWADYQGTTELPKNSYLKVLSGFGEGAIFSIRDNLLRRVIYSDGGYGFDLVVDNIYGVEITEENREGIYWGVDYAPSGLVDWASFGFFQNNLAFLKDTESTVTKVSSEGVEYQFVDNSETIEVKDSLGAVPTIDKKFYPNLRTNSNYLDMKLYAFGGANNWLDWDANSHIYYTEPLNEPSFSQGYNNTNVNDKLRSTYDYAKSTGTIRGTERPSIQMSYYCEDIPEKFSGIAVDVEINSTVEQYTDGKLPTTSAIFFEAHVVFVYNTTDGSMGDKYVEGVIDSDSYIFRMFSGYRMDMAADVINIGSGYYTDDTTTDTINAPTDNREVQAYQGGEGEPYYKFVLRGGDLLAIDSSIAETKPSAVYVSVGANYNDNNTEYRLDFSNLEVKVKSIAFVASDVTSTEPLESIDVDISGRNYDTASVAIEEISKLQNYSQFEAVTADIDVDNTPVRRYETSESNTNTAKMLQELHRETWTVGYLARDSRYVSRKIVGLLGGESTPASTHIFTVPYGCKLSGSVTSYEYDNLPTGGTFQYDRQPDGKYLKSISVTNADKDVFDSSYVTGVSDIDSAYKIWSSARLVYKKTGVLVDVRSDQSKLNWIYREEDVAEYILNVFKWNGGNGFSRDVISASIEVVDIDSGRYPWFIGDYCSLYIPRITQSAYTGVITGVTFNYETLSATLDLRVAQVVANPDTITEVGAGLGADTITELDSNTDTITEQGVQI